VEQTEVLIKEYETLRRESLDSITHRTQVASFGLAAVGALFAGPFLAGEGTRSTELLLGVLAFGVPLVSVLVLRMWLGEFERMQRAGSYLCWLEHRINILVGKHVLSWESWLREGDRLLYPYFSVVALFSLIGIGAPIAGALSTRASSWEWLVIIPGIATTLVVGVHAAFRVHKPKFRMEASTLDSWFQLHKERDEQQAPITSVTQAQVQSSGTMHGDTARTHSHE
jgi:hypothetical protein